ncbi:hypothetical protein [Paenibacillus sp. KS-LC4]|uniref:hypothetical protein n=1 Tax=Paenibacillus sp. KS-LC4 TaxID=2979727 RepID=UPI0030D40AA1
MMLKKVGSVKRIVISLSLFVVIAPVLMNFIPIKFAVKLVEAQQRQNTGEYICVTEAKYVLDTGWIAKTNINSHLKENLAVRVSRNSPNKFLSEKEFDFGWYELENRFLLIGNVESFEKDKETKVRYANLNVDEWEIVYPIKRASFRKYFTPNSYLNIYDYDLIKVITSVA